MPDNGINDYITNKQESRAIAEKPRDVVVSFD